MARSYRFFAEDVRSFEQDVSLSGSVDAEIVEQLGKVLRVKTGDEVTLLPLASSGPPFFEYRYTVESAHKKGVELSFQEKIENRNELECGLELVLCLPNKPDKLSMVLQKAVELGVSRVTLVEGEFSQMKHALREDRLLKILKEAAEQSERAVVPELVIDGGLKDYLAGAPETLLVAMERAETQKLSNLVGDGDVLILVGPEGGFSDDEKALIHERGLRCFSLGRRVLRMETAAIVALGIASLR